MAQDYIPTTDAGKLAFGQNAVSLITPAPIPWGLTAAIATTLAGKVTDFADKLEIASADATKSRSNTFAKNESKKTMEATLVALIR